MEDLLSGLQSPARGVGGYSDFAVPYLTHEASLLDIGPALGKHVVGLALISLLRGSPH